MDKVFLLLAAMLMFITGLFALSMPEKPEFSPVPELTGTPPDKDWFRESVLEAKGNVLVFFTAPWCGVCKEMEPRLKRLARQHKDALKLVQVDGNSDPELSSYYKAEYVPFLMLFVDGKPVGVVQGAAPDDDLRTMLSRYL